MYVICNTVITSYAYILGNSVSNFIDSNDRYNGLFVAGTCIRGQGIDWRRSHGRRGRQRRVHPLAQVFDY